MKKIKILSFASLPLAMALLAGCGHEHTFSDEWTKDANKHWHDATCEHKDQVKDEGPHVDEDKNNKCDVCGYEMGTPTPIGCEVTAEEWLASFGTDKPYYLADNYKLSTTMTMGEESSSGDIIVDGLKLSAIQANGSLEDNIFNEIVEKQLYQYDYDSVDKKWTKSKADSSAADDFAFFLEPFAANYTSFAYDEASKSYKCASLTYEHVVCSNLMIKFENKKIVSFTLTAPIGEGGAIMTVAASIVYGGQTVTLPDVPAPVVDPHKVDEAGWKAAFGADSFIFMFADNYKSTINMTGGPMAGNINLTVDGNKLKNETGTNVVYYSFENENPYSYSMVSSKWVKTQLPSVSKLTEAVSMYFEQFGNFAIFAYDETSQSYKAASFMDGMMTNLVVSFLDGKVVSASCDIPNPSDSSQCSHFEASFVYGEQVVTLPEVEEPTHEHVFDALCSDQNNHWYECSCGEVKQDSVEAHYDNEPQDGFCDACGCEMGESPIPELPIFGLEFGGETLNMVYNSELVQYEYCNLSLEANDELTVKNITPGAEGVLTSLTIGDEAHGFTVTSGVLKASVAGNYSFYLKPAFENDVIYIAENTSPIPGEPVYGYKLNGADYIEMFFQEKNGQWEAYDIAMQANETITIANICGSLSEPVILTSLSIGGETQGFAINEGVLTAEHDGNYNFYLVPEFGSDRIYIAENSSPTPETQVYLMGSFDEWSTGMPMALVDGSQTEYFIENVVINAGETFKVKQGTDDSGYCGTWKTEGDTNALKSGLMIIDESGNAKALVDLVINVYYESATEGGQGFGTYVELNGIIKSYQAIGTKDGVSKGLDFEFDKVENGYAQYVVTIPEGFVSSEFVYSINKGDNILNIEVEDIAEGSKFQKQSDNTFKYVGSATTLKLYLKVYLDGSKTGLYVANPADPVTYNTLYLAPGVWDKDGATFCAYFFDSTGAKTELWVMLTAEDGLYKVDKVEGYDKVIFVRCDPAKNPLVDQWDAKWNQTEDLDVPSDENIKCSISDWGTEKSPSTWGNK